MSGYVVGHVAEVTFMEGRDRDSLKPVKGWLGVGHIDGDRGRREIFGEVMNGDRDYRAFTMRCYEMDEYLDLDRMRTEGLVLDAGTSRNMVFVPGDQIELALASLPRPVSQLQAGDTVQLRRNPDHPAWKDRVEGEYGMEFTPKPDFEPVIAEGIAITDRTDFAGRGTQFRAQNGFWYDANGSQVDSGATEIVSEISISGAKLAQAGPAAPEIAMPTSVEYLSSDDVRTYGRQEFDSRAQKLGQFGTQQLMVWERLTHLDEGMKHLEAQGQKVDPDITAMTADIEGWMVDDLPEWQSTASTDASHRKIVSDRLFAARDGLDRSIAQLGLPPVHDRTVRHLNSYDNGTPRDLHFPMTPRADGKSWDEVLPARSDAERSPSAELDRFDRAAVTLGEQIDAYSGVISQWNRHNEKMQPRIESGWRSIQVAEDDLDHFGSLAKRDPELPGFDASEVARRRAHFADRLEESSVELTTGMDRIGAHLPQKRVAPSAEHVARLAELKSAPSRFEQPALAENEASLA